ncbi:MAG: o-succinylbenzoate synthase, partial [Halothece sp. Uz-M2-17]|nr:o-succinylbenzoate synthase [Halothece sp. Uz-M2-17]
ACYEKGWRGIFVLKCAIAGSPRLLRQWCQQHQLDLVFSSVMETSVAREAVFRLARELNPQRALGFGIDDWFEE